MNNEMNISLFQKYTLKLNSRTERRMLSEAKTLLRDIYPYEVSEKNLYLEKSKEKGFYDIYVSKEEIKKKTKINGLIIFGVLFSILIAISILVVRRGLIEKENTIVIQREKEEIENQKIKEKQEKESRLDNLKQKYLTTINAEYEKIFPFIERIYSCMSGNTTIENITLEKSGFSVEVTTKDALKVLGNFENSVAFNSVKMNRTTVKDKEEIVIYSGTFVKVIETPKNVITIDEKLNFYENELNRVKLRKEKIGSMKLSEYIGKIREVLRKSGCTEEYIQIKGTGISTEIQFFIISSSSEILSFLKSIQDESENLFDISQVKIRNSEDRNNIQTTVCFDSCISLDAEKRAIEELKDEEYQISEIDKAFYKVSNVRMTRPKINSTETVQKKTETEKTIDKKTMPVKALYYLGLTKSGNETFVMAKDDDMGSIYKLKLSETGPEENMCIKSNYAYLAKIRGEYFEVKNDK